MVDQALHEVITANEKLKVLNTMMQNVVKEVESEKEEKRDPKVGTGKKPKGSDRRLYTDENPRDTVSIKFATPADARATVAC